MQVVTSRLHEWSVGASEGVTCAVARLAPPPPPAAAAATPAGGAAAAPSPAAPPPPAAALTPQKTAELRAQGIDLVHALVKRVPNWLTEHPQVLTTLMELWASPERCLLYTSPSPRDGLLSRMPSSA